MYPLVSILIPVYNASTYLSQCLDSILNQSYRNIQIVIVDDGSTDDSFSICKGYTTKDQRIELYHKRNEGVAAARNDLLSHIQGDYFLFVDSDDWMESNMIEELLRIQGLTRADIVICGVQVNDKGNCKTSNLKPGDVTVLNQESAIEKFLYHKTMRGSLWNKLFKTSILGNVRFDSNVSYGEDALFCWGVLQRVATVVIIDTPLYHYRINDQSISHYSFGQKKFSAHLVWQEICKDTKLRWSQFFAIAQARSCIEDTLLLRDAAHCRYNDMEVVTLLQESIKCTFPQLSKVNITSFKMRLYAFLSSRCYWLARFF